MIIRCPGCGVRYRISPGKTEKTTVRVKCPKCSGYFEVDMSHRAADVQDPAGASSSSSGSSPPTESSGSGRPILVVDDSPFFRELVQDVLKPLGLELSAAANGVEALELIRRDRPSLVLLDLNLPQMDGYELIRRIRREADLSKVRLLAMSGVYRREIDVAEVQQAGADDFISKSFTPDQLRERVRKLLED